MKHVKIKVLLMIVCLLLGLSLWFAWQEHTSREEGILLHVIDVGQGDCLVIETPQGNVMIDTGPDVAERALRGYLRSHGLTEFSYMILSHPHDDHIGNADMVLREFDVERVICTDSTGSDPTWQIFLDVMEEAGAIGKTEWIKPISGTVCWVGEVRIEVLFAPPAENEGGNNDSMILRIDHGASSMLLMGDAEALQEEILLSTIPTERLQVDLLKVAHHGSSGSTGDAFLQAVSPKMALVISGAGNTFSHPHEEVLTRLQKRNIEIFRTDINGSLCFFSDGNRIVLKTLFGG